MKDKLILIGTSTGGPGHLKKILSKLHVGFDIPIVIAQHMNEVFIKSFVKQFDDELPFDFYLASDKHIIKSSSMYICGNHCEFNEAKLGLMLEKADNVDSHYNPSVNHLFMSAVKLCSKYDVLAILLTGIGSDGAMGLSKLQEAGATCIAESEESAIVFGMPKKAAELNSAIKVMNLERIADYVKNF